MSRWMPVRILAILAVSTLRSSIGADLAHVLPAAVATAVTVLVHLIGGRRSLLSVGAGTATFVVRVIEYRSPSQAEPSGKLSRRRTSS